MLVWFAVKDVTVGAAAPTVKLTATVALDGVAPGAEMLIESL